MSIRYQHDELIRTTPEQAFAVIDDLPLTAKWLPPCISLESESSKPNAVGDKLRYVFKQGGQKSEMAGEIVARTPNKRLHCVYVDSMFAVSVDLYIDVHLGGVMTKHLIEITPQSLVAKMMWPLIRIGIGKQTREAAKNLKNLLESKTTKPTPDTDSKGA